MPDSQTGSRLVKVKTGPITPSKVLEPGSFGHGLPLHMRINALQASGKHTTRPGSSNGRPPSTGTSPGKE